VRKTSPPSRRKQLRPDISVDARKLVVLVDPATHDYEVDWERSALVNGLMQFTLSDEDRTYDLSGQAEPLMEILHIFKDNNIP
jgi:hypothetical protein